MDIRYVFVFMSFFTLAFVGVSAHADDVALIKQRMLMEALSYRVIADSSLYSIHDGDTAVAERLNALLVEGDEYASQVQSRWPHLTNSWTEIRAFTERNLTLGLYKESAYAAWLEGLTNTIVLSYADTQAEITKLPEQLHLELEMLVMIERLMSTYLRFSNHLFGGHGGVGIGIEEQVKQFEDNLSRLKNQKVKHELERHWFFVKATLLAYNERSAVYIVERSCTGMRHSLLNGLK